MAALNVKVMQESPIFHREGFYPCKVLACNLGSSPDKPYGHYATAVKVFPKEGKPYIVPYSIHHFKSISRVYRDFEERVIIFGG